eukprot:14078502-Alexandrium_andersonii.AAC.1
MRAVCPMRPEERGSSITNECIAARAPKHRCGGCRWHRCDAWRSELCMRTETGSSGGTRMLPLRRNLCEDTNVK